MLTHANLAANARVLRRGVAHHGRGPLPGGAAALPRPRPRQRRLLVARERLPHAARGALRERQGAGALRRVPADALLRRADRVRAPRSSGRPRSARRLGAGVRLFVSGSAPLPAAVFQAFRERFGHAILERYGMTETLMTLGNPYDGERRPGTVGRPFAGVETADRRRGRVRGGGGRDRRTPGARPVRLRRVLAQARGDGRRVHAGRVLSHRRPGRARGRRLRDAARPRERPHHQRRLQRLPAGDRGRAGRAAGGQRSRGRRPARRDTRRGAGGVLRRQRRSGGARGRLPARARVLQAAARLRPRRGAAAQRDGQGGQGPARRGRGSGAAAEPRA